MDADLYDEFGNYIGPELDSDSEEEESEEERPEPQLEAVRISEEEFFCFLHAGFFN